MTASLGATCPGERIDRGRWPTRRAARQAFSDWLAGDDQRPCRHAALGSRCPVAEDKRPHQAAPA
jgi:hypothetical protein